MPIVWFDDISPRATGSAGAVEKAIVVRICSLHKQFDKERLSMASNFVVFCFSTKIAARIVRVSANIGIAVKATVEGRDFGLDGEATSTETRDARGVRAVKRKLTDSGIFYIFVEI